MKTERSKDADYVNNIIAHYSSNARNTGKLIAVLVIILSVLIPKDCKTSFILGMCYLAFEYMYCISIAIMYKYLLRKYFVSIEDGFALKDDVDPSVLSREIATYGSTQMVINLLILLAAFGCLL